MGFMHATKQGSAIIPKENCKFGHKNILVGHQKDCDFSALLTPRMDHIWSTSYKLYIYISVFFSFFFLLISFLFWVIIFFSINYNAVSLCPHELITLLFNPIKPLFCAQNSNFINQRHQLKLSTRHFTSMNYNALSFWPFELTSLADKEDFWHKMIVWWGCALELSIYESKMTMYSS